MYAKRAERAHHTLHHMQKPWGTAARNFTRYQLPGSICAVHDNKQGWVWQRGASWLVAGMCGAGRTVTRFKAFERFGHWLLAGSFILLGITGLITLFGRVLIAPYLGKELNATFLELGKWVHNNVAWAFIAGLVIIFVMWVAHNLPDRTDLVWISQAGGIVGSKHPPAKKFNAGQKVIFWSVVLFGASISITGVSLLFPYELPMFAKTFSLANDIGLSSLLGFGELSETLAPQEEMQLAQLWHAILAFVLMAIVIAHIYIGSVGMEGAYDAMGSGEVDEAWAKQHHSIWLEEIQQGQDPGPKAE